MTYKCDICCDSKKIILPRNVGTNIIDQFDAPEMTRAYQTFDCPQCVPMVPYRRVRATKIMTAYKAEDYGRFQAPIERALAARFGEYLLREGLIKFTTTGSKDFGTMSDKITVTAHMGVVAPREVERAGATPEIALASAPPVPQNVMRQRNERLKKLAPRAVEWKPAPASWAYEEPVTDEFDEPKSALDNRFQGLDI
jgi:hypothetical protein